MTAKILPLIIPHHQPTEAERYVLRMAERADMVGRERMMTALAKSVALLKEIAQLDRGT